MHALVARRRLARRRPAPLAADPVHARRPGGHAEQDLSGLFSAPQAHAHQRRGHLDHRRRRGGAGDLDGEAGAEVAELGVAIGEEVGDLGLDDLGVGAAARGARLGGEVGEVGGDPRVVAGVAAADVGEHRGRGGADGALGAEGDPRGGAGRGEGRRARLERGLGPGEIEVAARRRVRLAAVGRVDDEAHQALAAIVGFEDVGHAGGGVDRGADRDRQDLDEAVAEDEALRHRLGVAGARGVEIEARRGRGHEGAGLGDEPLQQRGSQAHAHVAVALRVEGEAALFGDVEATRERGREEGRGDLAPRVALREGVLALQRGEHEVERRGQERVGRGVRAHVS